MAPSSSSSASSASRGRGKGFALVAAVYLLGLFIGALDTGIVTPARTVIQSDLGIGEQMGVWIITIYTLAYAAAIPVMGKLADRSGRKYVYLASILLFGVGSLLCGLAQDVGSFWMLLAARAVQAVGGGGIVPVATAEFGTTFPPEKRGLALGLVGGVYGIANIFGASAGSLILSVFGQANWQFIFYVNVPICAFIVVAGLFVLPNTRAEQVKPIDGWGIAVLVAMVLSLLYGLKNLDFFDLGASATSSDVWPFLLAFVVLLPVFVLIERRAADPVLNLSYFRDRDIVITLVLSVITGVILMGIIFIPQFAENVLKLPSGSGGYVVIVLAAFAGVGAPVSGKLIDRFGVKAVLAFGLAASAAGAMFLALVATQFANMATLIISLVAIGIGMGFTIGTPLNYMMLAKTKEREANSALATLSLVRSVGGRACRAGCVHRACGHGHSRSHHGRSARCAGRAIDCAASERASAGRRWRWVARRSSTADEGVGCDHDRREREDAGKNRDRTGSCFGVHAGRSRRRGGATVPRRHRRSGRRHRKHVPEHGRRRLSRCVSAGGDLLARGVGAACALPGRQAAARAGEGGAGALIARNCHPGRRAGNAVVAYCQHAYQRQFVHPRNLCCARVRRTRENRAACGVFRHAVFGAFLDGLGAVRFAVRHGGDGVAHSGATVLRFARAGVRDRGVHRAVQRVLA